MERPFCKLWTPLGISLLISSSGLLSPLSGTAAEFNVTILNFAFDPPSITINVGDTVTWANSDGVGHTATCDAGDAICGSPILNANGTPYSKTFDQAGVFAYHCIPHPFMTGSVTVVGNSTPAIQITQPATGTTFTAPAIITIQAEVNPAGPAPASVELFSDPPGSIPTQVFTAPPYSQEVATASVPPGAYTLLARATDSQGGVTTSEGVSITIRPALAIVSPRKLADGTSQFTISGGNGSEIIIEKSPNLLTWTPIHTQPAPTDTFDFTDPAIDPAGMFYRAKQASN